jgi:hypothetical protein
MEKKKKGEGEKMRNKNKGKETEMIWGGRKRDGRQKGVRKLIEKMYKEGDLKGFKKFEKFVCKSWA